MNNDRFTDFDDEVRQLVLDFERTVLNGENQFYDVDELEMIIDYYLEVQDKEPLMTALIYAEQLYPESTEIKIRRAHWYIANRQFDRALEILLRLEEQEPDNTDIAYSLGVLYGEMEQSEKAIDYFLQAATDGWQLGRIYANIAEEYYKMHDYNEAIQYYLKAFGTDSYDVQTFYNYLDTCQQAGICDEAVQFFKLYVESHPYGKEGWYCLGCAYRDLGMFDRAIDAEEYAIAIDKSYAMAYFELSRAQEEGGHAGDAATTLIRYLDVAGDRAEVYRALGDLFVRQDNFETAMLYYKKAVVENEADAYALAGLAMCCMHMGDLSMALSYVKKALAADAENPDALCCAAMIYDSRGNVEMANDYFDRCIVSPRCTEAHCRYYAVFLFNREFYDTLIDFAEESLEIYPHDIFYSTYLAAACFYTNRYNKLRHALPDVHPVMLREMCPAIWENPRLAPLLPEMRSDDEFQTPENNE